MSGGLLTVFSRKYVSQASALFAAMTTQPSSERKAAINTLIKALIACGAWDTYDGFYMAAAHALQPSLLDWTNPGTRTLVEVSGGAPTFTVDRGFTGDGLATGYNTNFNPATTVGRKITNTSAHLGVFRLDNTGANNAEVGNLRARWTSKSATNVCSAHAVASTGDTVQTGNTAALGHYNWFRNNGSTFRAYRDGVFLTEPARAQGGHPGQTFLICGRNDSVTPVYSTAQLALVHFGMTQTDAMQAAQYAAILQYMQRVGAA